MVNEWNVLNEKNIVKKLKEEKMGDNKKGTGTKPPHHCQKWKEHINYDVV